MTAVKICGLRAEHDAIVAMSAGADFLGFVFEPSSVRYVGSQNWNPDWLAQLNVPKVAVYGKYSGGTPSGFDYIQAVEWDAEPPDEMRAIRVFRPGQPNAQLSSNFRAGDCLLIDAFESGSFGGSGKVADWTAAAEIVRKLTGVRVFLAGGLHSGNVAEAIQLVAPFGVDVSSGVESEPGEKDGQKIAEFLSAIRLSG